MKKLILVLVLLALVGAGYWAYQQGYLPQVSVNVDMLDVTQDQEDMGLEENEIALTGEVVTGDVDFSSGSQDMDFASGAALRSEVSDIDDYLDAVEYLRDTSKALSEDDVPVIKLNLVDLYEKYSQFRSSSKELSHNGVKVSWTGDQVSSGYFSYTMNDTIVVEESESFPLYYNESNNKVIREEKNPELGIISFRGFEHISPNARYVSFRVGGWEWGAIVMMNLSDGKIALNSKEVENYGFLGSCNNSLWTNDGSQYIIGCAAGMGSEKGLYATKKGDFPSLQKISDDNIAILYVDENYLYTLSCLSEECGRDEEMNEWEVVVYDSETLEKADLKDDGFTSVNYQRNIARVKIREEVTMNGILLHGEIPPSIPSNLVDSIAISSCKSDLPNRYDEPYILKSYDYPNFEYVISEKYGNVCDMLYKIEFFDSEKEFLGVRWYDLKGDKSETTYTNDEYGFSIQVPGGWKVYTDLPAGRLGSTQFCLGGEQFRGLGDYCQQDLTVFPKEVDIDSIVSRFGSQFDDRSVSRKEMSSGLHDYLLVSVSTEKVVDWNVRFAVFEGEKYWYVLGIGADSYRDEEDGSLERIESFDFSK